VATEGKIRVGITDDYLDTTVVEQTDGLLAHREAVVIADPEHAERVVVLPIWAYDEDDDFIFLLSYI